MKDQSDQATFIFALVKLHGVNTLIMGSGSGHQSKNMNPCINQYMLFPMKWLLTIFWNRKITMKSPILHQCLTTAHLLLVAAWSCLDLASSWCARSSRSISCVYWSLCISRSSCCNLNRLPPRSPFILGGINHSQGGLLLYFTHINRNELNKHENSDSRGFLRLIDTY